MLNKINKNKKPKLNIKKYIKKNLLCANYNISLPQEFQ